jgi:hypothetical protein
MHQASRQHAAAGGSAILGHSPQGSFRRVSTKKEEPIHGARGEYGFVSGQQPRSEEAMRILRVAPTRETSSPSPGPLAAWSRPTLTLQALRGSARGWGRKCIFSVVSARRGVAALGWRLDYSLPNWAQGPPSTVDKAASPLAKRRHSAGAPVPSQCRIRRSRGLLCRTAPDPEALRGLVDGVAGQAQLQHSSRT